MERSRFRFACHYVRWRLEAPSLLCAHSKIRALSIPEYRERASRLVIPQPDDGNFILPHAEGRTTSKYTEYDAANVEFLSLPVAMHAQADTQWVLDQSTLSYQMSHPMHQVDGVSRAAKGKGTCHAGQCGFLIAAPVKSFDSGDTNRDLNMRESTRGAQFPMVVVRTSSDCRTDHRRGPGDRARRPDSG